jgi:hypothetical protein
MLLRDRYGWRPLPFAIPTDEFEVAAVLGRRRDAGCPNDA